MTMRSEHATQFAATREEIARGAAQRLVVEESNPAQLANLAQLSLTASIQVGTTKSCLAYKLDETFCLAYILHKLWEPHMSKSAAAAARDFRPDDLAGPGLRAFFALARAWRLTEHEQMMLLGLVSRSTLHSWKAGRVNKVSRDTLERISYMLGIFKAIGILLPVPERADAWMRAPNEAPLFGGRSPLDRMTSGNVADLYLVRQYLDAQRS